MSKVVVIIVFKKKIHKNNCIYYSLFTYFQYIVNILKLYIINNYYIVT